MPRSRSRRRPAGWSYSVSFDEQDEKAATAWANTAPMEVLACRKYGHQWPLRDIGQVYRINGGYLCQKLQCDRCGMVRVDLLNSGEYGVTKRRYFPPTTYRRDAPTGRSSATPRYLIEEAVISRADILTPPDDVLAVYEAFQRGGRAW